MTTPRELQAHYAQGGNITQRLREESGLSHNTDAAIEIAYDLQTGSYIAALEDAGMAAHKRRYTAEIARVIRGLCEPSSILEAGVGEATTLAGVASHLDPSTRRFGFDLSWSRVAMARRYLQYLKLGDTTLGTGNLLDIPFADASIDVVYTSHSIEPNGGKEVAILQELYRVTRRFLVLLEPGYELAGEAARGRMESHGYCRGLPATAASLGYEVRKHELFPHSANPLNPTAITVIGKPVEARVESPAGELVCPKLKTPLEEIGGMLFSPEALVAYPVVGGIPCLRVENGVFASKYKELMAG